MNESYWTEIRNEFNLDPRLLHFGAFWLSSYPRKVRESIDFYRAELDRNPVFYVVDNEDQLDSRVRQVLASYVNGNPNQIVLVGSTTEGLMLAVGMLSLDGGDEVLTTSHEHYSAYSAVQALCARTKATIQTIALYEDGEILNEQAVIQKLVSSISERTRLIVLTWVHSCTGVKLPLPNIAERLAEINSKRPFNRKILLCADATHAFGVIEIDLSALGCDIFVTSCHKWLNGPRGTGFVHLSALALSSVMPLTPSFAPAAIGAFTGRMPASAAPWERLTPGGFHAFENRWSIPAAIGFSLAIGPQRIEQRVCELATRMKGGLANIKGLRLVTPKCEKQSAGIICFELESAEPEQVVQGLRARDVVASVSPYRIRYARLTPSIYNTLDEVDAAVERLHSFARTL